MSGLVPLLVPSAPAVVSSRSVRRSVGRPLPLPSLPVRWRERQTVYGLASVDASGRVGDRTVVRALGWACGTTVRIIVDAGRLVVVAAPGGAHRVGARGFVRLPARLRRRWGIEAADRVLLVGELATGVLVVYPLASLDALLAAPAGSDGGGSAALAGAA